jgi:hypothetical protein
MTTARLMRRHAPSSTFRLGAEILESMALLEERDGIPPSEQARRALIAFLTQKGFPPATPTPAQIAARMAVETKGKVGLSAAGQKAVATKGKVGLSAAGQKAAATRRARKGVV